MIEFTTGNLFDSDAQALVNTVNCEGFMGKGIAYQFKKRYPKMFEDYQEACADGRVAVGTVHMFRENGKMIINFPTKDRWRAKSKMEYVSKGLDALSKLIIDEGISSVAMPPLGVGNGGLVWSEVKKLIIEKLSPIENDVRIVVYEPSDNIQSRDAAPELDFSALVLMKLKLMLDKNKFTVRGLHNTACFFNWYYGDEYFTFRKDKLLPYDSSIDDDCGKIKAFQEYYNVDTSAAYDLLHSKIVSKRTESKLKKMLPAIEKAAKFSNSLDSSLDIEGTAAVLRLVQTNNVENEDDIVRLFAEQLPEKSDEYSREDILRYIDILCCEGFMGKSIFGISVL